MRDFRQLEVWRVAHQLTLAVYRETVYLPKQETYGLMAQLRRSVLSIEANISQGCGKNDNIEFAHFLQNAFAAANQTECELLVAFDLGYLREEVHARLVAQIQSVRKMLTRFTQYLRTTTSHDLDPVAESR